MIGKKLIFGFLLLCSAAVWPVRAEEIVELDSRPGVKQRYLLTMDNGVAYRAAAVMIMGQGGDMHLTPGKKIKTYRSFLLGSRQLFADAGIAVACIDSPSDMKGLTSLFRKSDKHLTDISAVIADLKRRVPGAKIYLIGTSMGSVSAAFAGVKLADQIDGIVLTSSVFSGDGAYGLALSGFDFDSIKVPVLIVHHRDDDCGTSYYRDAARLGKKFPLISVSGGETGSDRCLPKSHHQFSGKEKEAVAAIADWIFGRKFPSQID